MGSSPALVDNSATVVLRSDDQVVVHVAAGPTLLDLNSGQLRRVPAGGTYWCSRDEIFRQAPGTINGTRHLELHEGTVAMTCDADGKATIRPAQSLPSSLSASAPGGMRIVSTPSGLTAYRTR